jgi:hypothetical protein
MATNTSVWLVANIFIWELAMSGWWPNHSGWSVFMDGKEIILTGKLMPFAMIVSERIAMDMFSQGTTSGQSPQRRRRRRTANFDWRSHFPAPEFKIIILREGHSARLKKLFYFSFLQVENRPDMAKRAKKTPARARTMETETNAAVTRTDGNGNFEPH